MDFGINGKWALVCGASKGLGLGCAKALVQEGVNVMMVARGAEALQAAAAALMERDASKTGAIVQWLAVDITTEAGRAAVLAQRADFDILVTNAGGPPAGDFRSFERDDWIRALDANMLTPIALIKATVDGMAARGFGRIVNITSGAVKAPIDVLGLSNGARSGLTGFVAGLARSGVAAKGVTINNLLPGAFDTERLQSIFQGAAAKTAQPLDVVAAARRNTIPARRFGSPDEFGAICAFLCSQQAAYMTGQNVLADGGAYPGTF
ncbi:SDR family oxidoreductase [Rhodoferax sp.]|uniref:SDR family oxidoreductase n=1 Tax=Rhodoferax sp. TaxID=50421 RepID=UPI002715CAC6|nr:SDR family oxidoreductase [Rhodoferax sp.]MDO8317917.1 SDR family oxidoreductase [Rhodoferax sp.]